MQFKKASKKQSRLRAAIFGPSGSGKTYTALSIASGMGGKIAVIDSERGSASKYADRFDFDVLEAPRATIEDLIKGLTIAQSENYNVVIIDSMSHAWQELLEDVEKIAKAKYKGNTWSAWSEGTPEQKKLMDAILTYDGHIISTMRSKTEWQTDTSNGKSRPIRVGLAPEQGKGIEYEFDLLIEMSADHIANIIKDRTGKFQDALIEKPGAAFGKQLIDWLSEGAPVEKKPTPNTYVIPFGSLKGKTFDEVEKDALSGFYLNLQNHVANLKKTNKPVSPEVTDFLDRAQPLVDLTPDFNSDAAL